MAKRYLHVITIVLFLCVNLFGNEKIVRVVTLKDYSPFCMIDKNFKKRRQIIPVGKDAIGFKGYSWDILRESFQASGYTIDLLIVPWARAMKIVKASKADILFPAGINSKRKKIFYYSKHPVDRANFVVYVRKGSKIKWKGLDSLKGLKIGVVRGFNYGDEWTKIKGIKKYSVNTILQGFKMLAARRLDGFLGYEYNGDYVLIQNHMKNEFKKLPSFGYTSEYLVALKTNPNAKKFLNAYDNGFELLQKSGELKKIKEKWFGQ